MTFKKIKLGKLKLLLVIVYVSSGLDLVWFMLR